MVQKNCFEKIFYPKGVSPFPGVVLSTLFSLMLLNAITMTMLFAFLPRLVKFFGSTEITAGYYAGFIASAFFAGRAIFSFGWGYLADRKGKKFVLITSSTGLAIFTLAFGFSSDFYMAFFTRLAQGCFAGIVISCNAIVNDIADETNSAFGMAILTSSFSTGLIFGPSIGGFLVFPAERFPDIFTEGSVFSNYPILLAHIFVVIVFIPPIYLAIKYISPDNVSGDKVALIPRHETKKYTFENSVFEDVINENVSVKEFRTSSVMLSRDDRSVSFQHSVLLNNSFKLENSYSALSQQDAPMKKTRILDVFRYRDCIITCIVYGIFSFYGIGFDEVFALYAATEIRYNGYGFSTSDIGLVFLIISVLLVVCNLFFTAKVTKMFGARKCFLYFGVVQAVAVLFFPIVKNIENKILFWVTMCTILLIIRVAIAGSYITISILICNSVSTEHVGSANGVGLACSCFGRSLAPTLFGSIFSWSLTNIKSINTNHLALGFPFNEYFVFIVFAVIVFLNALMVLVLPESLNQKKVEVTNIFPANETKC